MSSTITQTAKLSLKSDTGSQGKPVSAILNFFSGKTYDGDVPHNYVDPPAGVRQNNLIMDAITVPINDMRGRESTFDIDRNAFLPVLASDLTSNTNTNFDDDESVKQTYYPEVEQALLQNLPGSPNRVFIFDHTIRRQRPNSKREPVLRTHIDQTTSSALERVRFHLPNEADELLKGRVRLVNVWRPLNGAIESSPLAVADSNTVSADQLVGVEHRYPDRTGETAAVKHSDSTKWYYWSGMRNDERLFLQCFDTQSGSRVPHSAFKMPGEGEDGWQGKPRESIEVRALVFG